MWGGRRYYSLDFYLKEKFGEKLYKLSLDGGMTCPNRDGRISHGGCIFCSEGGSGDFAAPCEMNIDKQIEYAKSLVKNKFDGNRYIAYFQSYTNTYAPVEYLRKLFLSVIKRDDIAVLSVATRPDCLGDDVLELIAELAKIKPVWIELGLQTIHQKTADFINRGYDLECYDTAVRNLKKTGASVITHIIIGLPYETKEQIMQTAAYVGQSGADGIKLQLLHVLKNTKLEEIYNSGKFQTLSEDEYISLIADIINILPENIVIHRLTGDGDKKILISPLWSCNKRRVLNLINHRLKENDIIQGKEYKNSH
ncbi:MAG: TIGR01212 family radical SAM protein [Clostridia bacterium]|nr:TIGR01212 family radical SAM protein [Clostridia bacterium]